MSAVVFGSVSESADDVMADDERRVHSGPKERTRSGDNVQLGPSLCADGRSVSRIVSFFTGIISEFI